MFISDFAIKRPVITVVTMLSLVVFGIFMVAVLGEPVSWRHLAAFACIMGAVGFLFVGR